MVESAVVRLSGTFENSERLGAMSNHLECSALVIGVTELPQLKRPTDCRSAPIVASMLVHGDSGAGRSDIEWYVREFGETRGNAPSSRVQFIGGRCGRAAPCGAAHKLQTCPNYSQHVSA